MWQVGQIDLESLKTHPGTMVKRRRMPELSCQKAKSNAVQAVFMHQLEHRLRSLRIPLGFDTPSLPARHSASAKVG